jgi:DNA-3-methyladenine glycosylase
MASRLPRSFFSRPTPVVARDLLGRRLVRVLNLGPQMQLTPRGVASGPLAAEHTPRRLSGHIVEVEAYTGMDDAASHASRGRTSRNAAMFGRPGHAYVYFIYGMHWMFNVVARQEGPGAILVRRLVPEEGLDIMRENRSGCPDTLLTNGPARLAQALAIDGSLNGSDLCIQSEIFIEPGTPVPDELVACSPRVGVTGDELALTRPWRFLVKGSA